VFSNRKDIADNPKPVGLGILLLLEKLEVSTGLVISTRILLSHVNTSPNSVINST